MRRPASRQHIDVPAAAPAAATRTGKSRRLPLLLFICAFGGFTLISTSHRHTTLHGGSRWASSASQRPWAGLVPFEVEWRVPVGCGWSGFFVEVALGFVPPLLDLCRVVLLTGRCDDAFLATLSDQQQSAYRAAWADEQQRSPEQTRRSVVIEHGDACGMRRWRREQRPLWVISRTMTEGDVPPNSAGCLETADEVWVPAQWHVERFAAAGIERGDAACEGEVPGLDSRHREEHRELSSGPDIAPQSPTGPVRAPRARTR